MRPRYTSDSGSSARKRKLAYRAHKRIRASGRVPGEEAREAVQRNRIDRAISKRIREIADDSGSINTGAAEDN